MSSYKVLHKKSSVDGKVPTSEQLSYGEIALNYHEGGERIYIKNDNDDVIDFIPSNTVFDMVHPPVQTEQPVGGMLPNVLYEFGEISGSVTFNLASGLTGYVNHYYWTFDTGSIAPTITWPVEITSWLGGTPILKINKHYEISVLNGIAVYMEV